MCAGIAVGTGGSPYYGGSFGGDLGIGGSASSLAGAGGGGGYYGGGASDGSGAGGGSGYVSAPGTTDAMMTTGVEDGDGSVLITWD